MMDELKQRYLQSGIFSEVSSFKSYPTDCVYTRFQGRGGWGWGRHLSEHLINSRNKTLRSILSCQTREGMCFITNFRLSVFKANQWYSALKSQSNCVTFRFFFFSSSCFRFIGLTIIRSNRFICQPRELYTNIFR